MHPDPSVYLGGRFVSAKDARISIFDRAFCYGDGLFETARVCAGTIFRWREHLERLYRSAARLGIQPSVPQDELAEAGAELVQREGALDALVRVQLSRGVGPRGYSVTGADQALEVITLHPAPAVDALEPKTWKLALTSVRSIRGDPLAQLKTCNKLPQILARREAEVKGADEGLLLNTDGQVTEGSGSNLFWIAGGVVCTPPLVSPVLPGITRRIVLELCQELERPAEERAGHPAHLQSAQGVFLTLSSYGIVEAVSLNRTDLRRSELVQELHQKYQRVQAQECARVPSARAARESDRP